MKGSTAFLTFVLLISVAGNAYLFLNPKEKIIVKEEMPKAETEKIREIAFVCGVDSEAMDYSSVLSILSDIKSTLRNNTKTCDAAPLTQEETELVDSYLNYKPEILSKIKAQNAFISPYSMKRFILLPIGE